MVYCCVPFCKSRQQKGNGISFHTFPSDYQLCEKWLKCVSRENFTINSNSATSVVCSKHFQAEDYMQTLSRKKLKNGSFPTIFPGYPSYMVPKVLKVRTSKIKVQHKTAGQIVKRKVSGSLTAVKRQKLEECETLQVNSVDESKGASTADAELLMNFLREVHVNSMCSVVPSPEAECSYATHQEVPKLSAGMPPTTSAVLTYDGKSAKLRKKQKESRLLKSSLWKKNNKLLQQQKKINELQKNLSYYKKNKYHSVIEKLIVMQEEDAGNKQGKFLLEQIDNYFKKKPNWNEETLRECCIWMATSPKGYSLVRDRKLVKLPCRSTLAKYIGPLSGEVGVTSLIKERLKEECVQLNGLEKFSSLVIDEMAIKPGCTYDSKLDCFFGQKTSSDITEDSQQPLANRLLCFVLCGLSTRYAIPCGYFFSKQLTGKELYSLTLNVVTEVEHCGFKIIRIVTDNHKTNVAMFRQLGNGKLYHQVLHPCDSNRPLFLSFDPNHIIKNIRSLFLEREMTDGLQVISGKFIKFLYKLQQNESIRPVRNLTFRHIEPSNIDKMNVGRAVLIFSPPVTAALEFLQQNFARYPKAFQFQHAESTITFLKNIYKWFTVHNISNRHQGTSSLNKDKIHFFSCNDERLQWLEEEFPLYLYNVKQACENDPSYRFLSKETYEAIIITTKSTVECINYLLSSGFHYILTNRFNSDPVESHFSALRQMNGGNDVMDVRSTIFSLEKILKTGIVISSKFSNVGKGVGMISKTSLRKLENVKHLQKPRPSLPVEVLASLDTLETDQCTPKNSLKVASLAFVAGYLAKAFGEMSDCSSCLEMLASCDCKAPIFALISNQDRGGLTYPTPRFVMILLTIQDFVEKSLPYLPQCNLVQNLTGYILPKLKKCPTLRCIEDNHIEVTSNFICKKFLPIILKNIAKQVSDKIGLKVYNKPLSRKILKLT